VEFWADPFITDKPKTDKDKAALPFRPAKNDVTAALFMLLRTQDIAGKAFVCPSTGLETFDFGGSPLSANKWTNWPGRDAIKKHLSYSYQNPYPSADAIGKGFKLNNAISAEFAVASDMNPGGDGLLKLKPTAGLREAREGNSFNHDRDGQNVLYGDGHVEFLINPFVGVQRDNIFTFGESGNDAPDTGGDGIIGSSVGPDDSILLPTARDIGQVDEQGNFVGAPQLAKATAATLKVTDDQLVATSGPITITFGYTIDGLLGADAQLALTAPQTTGETARIQLAPNGDLLISKNMYFEGQWRRKN
jgi:prepilin-type processing-associated H-X9-DG protein